MSLRLPVTDDYPDVLITVVGSEDDLETSSSSIIETEPLDSVGSLASSKYTGKSNSRRRAGFTPDNDRAISELQSTFKGVLDEFKGNKSTELFMLEYDKLYEGLKSSHRESASWKQRCEAMALEVKANTDRLHLALHLATEDRKLVNSLSAQAADAWILVERLIDREKNAKENIFKMKQEIEALNNTIVDGMGVEELQILADRAHQEQKGLEQDNEMLRAEIDRMEGQFDELKLKNKQHIQQYEEMVEALRLNNNELLEKLEGETTENDKTFQKIRRMEKLHLRELSEKEKCEEENVEKDLVIKKEKLEVSLAQNQRDHYHKMFQEEKTKYDKLKKEMESQNRKFILHQQQLTIAEQQIAADVQKIKDLNGELAVRSKEVRDKDAELKTTNVKLKTQNNNLVITKENLHSCGETLKVNEAGVHVLETNLSTALKDVDDISKELKKTLNQLQTCDKKLRKMTKLKDSAKVDLSVEQRLTERLSYDIDGLHKKTWVLLDKLKQVINDKENIILRINFQATQIEQLESDIETLQFTNSMMEKQNLALSKELTEAIRNRTRAYNERDALRTAFNENEMQRRELAMSNATYVKQAKSLELEIVTRDAQYTKLKEKLADLRSQYNFLCNTLDRAELEKSHLKNQLINTETQLDTSSRMLAKQDQVISDKNITINEITTQRNILGATCLKNQEEIDLLKEKHSFMEQVISNGNKMYEDRVKEINLLKLQNTDTWRQKDVLMRKVHGMQDLKEKLGIANSELVNCKARLKVLDEQAPTHIHDWVAIKAKDYSKYELISKINYLLKRQILKSDEVARLESALLKKALIVSKLKKLASKAPGPEVMLNAALDRKAKESAERKLKATLAEINMAEWKTEERTAERDRLRQEIVEEKKKRTQAIKGYQKIVKRNEEEVAETKRFLPPIAIRGFK